MASLDLYETFRRDLKQSLSEGDSLTEEDECFFELVESMDNPKCVLEFARSLKSEGNCLFKEGNFDEAMEKYGYAGLALVRYNFEKEVDKLESFDLAISILLNLTACLSKTKDHVHVGQLCTMILDYRPNNVKALFRRAKAAIGLGKNEWAYWDLMKAMEIEPNNHEIRKALEEIKGGFRKDKVKVENNYEAPIGLGLGLPSVSKNCEKKNLRDLTSNFDRQQKEHVQDNFQEVLLDKGCKNSEEKCNQELILKEEEDYLRPIVDVNDQSPTSKVGSSVSNMLSKSCFIDGMSCIDGDAGEHVASYSSESSCVTEVPTVLTKKEDLTKKEAKCRFYNRRKQGSLLTLSKSDYLSMTKGKTLIYGNAKMGTYMQVRVVTQQPYDQKIANTRSNVEERVEQIHHQADGTEEDKDNSVWMEISSNVSSCLSREDPLSDNGNNSSGYTMTPYFHFSATKAPKPTMLKRRHARMKCDDAKYATTPKAKMENKRAKKMYEGNSFSYSCTNNGCVCRFEIGRKRKHGHPPLMKLCNRPRKKSTAYVSSSCFDVNYYEVVYGNVLELGHL